MRGEVVLFAEQRPEAAAGRIARDSRAVDATADDQQVVDRRAAAHARRCRATASAVTALTRTFDSSVTPAMCGVRTRLGTSAKARAGGRVHGLAREYVERGAAKAAARAAPRRAQPRRRLRRVPR